MSEGERELTALLGELTTAVEELQGELEPSGGPPRPPTPRELARFTSEVTIPAIILVLETNVRALRLVQRALRIADGREASASVGDATRERATALGRATVDRLDDALTDLQDALEGRPPDDDARELLDRVQSLQSEIESQLAEEPGGTPDNGSNRATTDTGSEEATSVDVDVDAELRSLKDDLDGDNSDEGENDND